MQEYEIKVTASYIPAGTKYWNSFKAYITANDPTEAQEKLKAELKQEGYIDIEISDVIAL